MKEKELKMPDEAALEGMTKEERAGFFTRLLHLLGVETEKAPDTAPEMAPNAATAASAAPSAAKSAEDAEAAGTAVADPFPGEPTEEETLAALRTDPRFPDFAARTDEARTILAAVPALATVAPRGRWLLGYFAARGLEDYRRKKEKPSAAELVDALCAREDAVKLYETKRIASLEASGAAYPRHVATVAASPVPAAPKKTPRNLDEACAAAFGLFGISR